MNKRYLDIYASHFGKIMSNYAIVGLSAMLLILVGTIVSAMISVLCVMFGILLIFATLGLVLVTNKNFISEMFNSGSHLLEITTSLYKFFPYLFGITLGASIISLIVLCLQKDQRSTGRIVASSIILALTVVAGFVFFLGVEKWKH